MRIMILGATGLTGSHLLDLTLEDPAFSEVLILTRRSTKVAHPKLKEVVADLKNLDVHTSLFADLDILFICVGTTRAKTPDRAEYRAIDYGIPLEAATQAKAHGVRKVIVVSAMGADPKSKVFYSRLKGEMERDVLALGIQETYFMRPSLIVGDRQESRLGERAAEIFMRLLDFMIPKKFKMVKAKTIAKAMIYLAKNNYNRAIIPSDDIGALAGY